MMDDTSPAQENTKKEPHEYHNMLSEDERERSFLFASQRGALAGGGKVGAKAGWTLGSSRRQQGSPPTSTSGTRERAATLLPSSTASPPTTLWGARPASPSGGASSRQLILLSRERAPPTSLAYPSGEDEKREGNNEAKQNEATENREKSDEEARHDNHGSEVEPKEGLGESGRDSKSGKGDRVSERRGSSEASLEEAERERELCPQGADCRSDDPRHFILFRHTARDEFSLPTSPPPAATLGNHAFLFTSRFDVVRSVDDADHCRQPAVSGTGGSGSAGGDVDPLAAKRAMLRRSTSVDSGLKREVSISNLTSDLVGGPGNRDEKSGWLHKRTPLRKNWVCFWFVLRPQTRQLLYYKSRADTTAQGKGPEGSMWLEDSTTAPAADSDGRSNCFRLITSRKTFQLSASDEETKWGWITAIHEAAARGKKRPPLGGSGLGTGNGSLIDFSPSFQQPLPAESNHPSSSSSSSPQTEGQKNETGESENKQKKEKAKKKKEREKNYASAYGRKIDWTGREMTTLPEKLYEFSNFDSLTKLVVRANQLSTFPGELSMLRGLTYLDYSENLIKELPKEIGALYRIKELYLESNRLERLPPEIGKLTRLRTLNIGNGVEWVNVVKVQTTVNRVKVLPDEIAQFVHLRSLDCSNNAISAIPPAFFEKCTKVEKLDFTGNQITRLPDSVGQLVKLQNLLLSHNRLEALPPRIGWLRELKHLHLVGNKITRLPPQLGRCLKLEQLWAEDNPIKDPPRHVFKLELTELLLHLSDLGKGEEQCFRTRVVLFGDEDKQKLFKAITGRKTGGDSSYLTTSTTTLKVKHGLLPSGANPTFDVWSFASELNGPMLEPDSVLPQLFLADEVMVVLAIRFDGIDADTLGRWFAMLRANAPHAAVVVLAYAAQPFPAAQHREILTDLRAQCDGQKGGLNLVLIELLNFKSGKELKAIPSVLVDVALRHIKPMGRPVQRGVLQLEQILDGGVDTNGPLSVATATIGMAAWADLCALCEVVTEEQRAQALKVLTWWGVLVHIPPGLLGEDALLAPSAPWLLDHLIKTSA